MKHLIETSLFFLCLILLSACSLNTYSVGFSPEERGYTCANAEMTLKNRTDHSAIISIDGEVPDTVASGHKYYKVIPAGKHTVCINDNCDEIKFIPCHGYDFSANLCRIY